MKAEWSMASVIRKRSIDYRQQRALFAGGVEPAIRNFTFVNTMLDYVITSSDGVIPTVFEKVKISYTIERDMCCEVKGQFIADDDEYVPVNTNDSQCTQCGISCLYAMFVVMQKGKGAKLAKQQPEAMCYQCARLYQDSKSSIQVVSLLSTFMARKLKLM
jgi:CO dehydrogenase/acetyl-CoA synthase alpha subunit